MKLLEYHPTPLLPSARDGAMNRELGASAAALNGARRSETREAIGNAPGAHDDPELAEQLLITLWSAQRSIWP